MKTDYVEQTHRVVILWRIVHPYQLYRRMSMFVDICGIRISLHEQLTLSFSERNINQFAPLY